MKIIEISIPTTLNKCPTSIDEIHIFTQFFIHKNNRRQHELLTCLKNNHNNPFITNIHLLNEKIYSWKEMGIDDEKDNKIKIIQTSIGKRLRFQDIFYYIRKNSLNGYFIFTNADIFLDSTIQNVKKSTLHEKKQMFALLRYEYNGILDQDLIHKIHGSFIPITLLIFYMKKYLILNLVSQDVIIK